MLIAGGLTAETVPAPWLERFDPGTSATLLPSGKVLLISHTPASDGWRPLAALYEPATGTVRAARGQPGTAREGHQALLLANPPMVLILGGDDGTTTLASAEWYDPATEQFRPCPNPMLSPRKEFGAAVLAKDRVLLLGGTTDGRTACASAEQFDPVTQDFAPTGALNRPRRQPFVLCLDSGEMLVLGGSNETHGCLAEVEVFSLKPPKPPPEMPPWRPKR